MFVLSSHIVHGSQSLYRALMMLAVISALVVVTASSDNQEATGTDHTNLSEDHELITEFDIWPVEASIGDVFFIPVPDQCDLDDQEYYILDAYAKDNPSLCDIAWWVEAAREAEAEYWNTGVLPEVLTEEFIIWHQIDPDIDSVDDLEEEDKEIVQYFKSPITGEYPYCKKHEFSPGNFYLKVLSDEEIMAIAAIDPRIAYISSGEECSISRWHSQDDIPDVETLATPPIYIRVYGNDQVLVTTLFYSRFSPEDFDRYPLMFKQGSSETDVE